MKRSAFSLRGVENSRRVRNAATLPIGNRRYSTARASRNRIARSVWSAAYPAALTLADRPVMRVACGLGNQKRRDTPHSKRFATSEPTNGAGLGKGGVNTLVLDRRAAIFALWQSITMGRGKSCWRFTFGRFSSFAFRTRRAGSIGRSRRFSSIKSSRKWFAMPNRASCEPTNLSASTRWTDERNGC